MTSPAWVVPAGQQRARGGAHRRHRPHQLACGRRQVFRPRRPHQASLIQPRGFGTCTRAGRRQAVSWQPEGRPERCGTARRRAEAPQSALDAAVEPVRERVLVCIAKRWLGQSVMSNIGEQAGGGAGSRTFSPAYTFSTACRAWRPAADVGWGWRGRYVFRLWHWWRGHWPLTVFANTGAKRGGART